MEAGFSSTYYTSSRGGDGDHDGRWGSRSGGDGRSGRGRSSPPLIYRYDHQDQPSPFDYDVGIAKLQRAFEKAEWPQPKSPSRSGINVPSQTSHTSATRTRGYGRGVADVGGVGEGGLGGLGEDKSSHGIQRSLDEVRRCCVCCVRVETIQTNNAVLCHGFINGFVDNW